MRIRLLYFARLRERFGLNAEHLALPPEVTRVGGLIEMLRSRGETWASELAEGRAFRVAVNQDMADFDTVLNADDEVALFPPVTGG
jgi:molybdopterin synthase sulfur carrier subunit